MDTGDEMYERAAKFQEAGNHAEAIKIYDMLLAQNPSHPALLANAGSAMAFLGNVGVAIALLEKAVQEQPSTDILCNLGIVYKMAGLYTKCREAFKKAVARNPTAETLANYAGLFINVGQPDEALKHARRAIRMKPEHPMAHWNASMAHLEKFEFAQGWDEYEWGFETRPPMRIKRHGFPYWDGTPGKTVVVYGEQGLGDEIMFASMIPDLMKTNTVILESHRRLKTLFEKSFGIQVYGTREEKVVLWPVDHEIDYAVSIGSLGHWLRRKREDFPGTSYLKADPLSKGRFRVGISWTGGRKEGRIRVRSVPLTWWGSIFTNPCEFVSLQYTDSDDDIEMAEKSIGVEIQRPPEAKADDYYETARLVASCDLVISCCTTVIHLAGALGVPCWVMVPNKPAWRYGVSGPMPWYRSVRLYRQPIGDSGAWMPVIERIGFDLSELIKERVAA